MIELNIINYNPTTLNRVQRTHKVKICIAQSLDSYYPTCLTGFVIACKGLFAFRFAASSTL